MTGWIMTYRGRQFRPFAPRPEDVDIIDIAQALSNTCRYGGHVRRFYSVAEHCVHLARWVPREHAFDALMHDAAEAYLGDIPRPIKRAPAMGAWRDAEWLVERAIGLRFGVTFPMPAAVHEADGRILLDEWAELMPPTEEDIGVSGTPLGVTIECWAPEMARRKFLDAFEWLRPAVAS